MPGRRQIAVQGGRADPEPTGHILDGNFRIGQQGPGLLQVLFRQSTRTSAFTPARTGGIQAGAGALALISRSNSAMALKTVKMSRPPALAVCQDSPKQINAVVKHTVALKLGTADAESILSIFYF